MARGGASVSMKVDAHEILSTFSKAAGAMSVGGLNGIKNRMSKKYLRESQKRAPKLTGALAGGINVHRTSSNVYLRTRSGQRYAAPIHWGWPARGIPRRAFIWDVLNNEKTPKDLFTAIKKDDRMKDLEIS